jgi:hypothetical protein
MYTVPNIHLASEKTSVPLLLVPIISNIITLVMTRHVLVRYPKLNNSNTQSPTSGNPGTTQKIAKAFGGDPISPGMFSGVDVNINVYRFVF